MILLCSAIFNLYGQENLDYQVPPKSILDLADANPAPSIRINQGVKDALLLHRQMYKSLEELSEEELRLAGLRINPKNFMPSRNRYNIGISYLNPNSGVEEPIMGLPNRGKYSDLSWNPTQNKVAVLNTSGSDVSLWVIDIVTKKAKKLSTPKILGSIGVTYIWLNDETLLIKTRGEVDAAIIDRSKIIPTGPTISENNGQKAQNRTYQDLLKNPTDEKNFETITTSELWEVNINGNKKKWLDMAIYDDLMLSPNGKYVLISKIKKPYSYLVPYYRFPYQYDIYDQNGNHVKTQFDIPLLEEMPKGFMSVTTEPRRINWRSDQGATLYWAEALDGGDAEKEVDFRDAIYQLEAPFTGEKTVIAKTKLRYSSIQWGSDDCAVLYDYWWNTRTVRTSFLNPSTGAVELWNERNYQDRYSDPGYFVTKRNDFGRRVLNLSNDHLYLIGDGYSEAGKFPFVDKLNVKSGENKRLFQVEDTTKLEDLVLAVNIDKGELLTRIESKTEYPNYYIRNINTGKLRPITQFENPFKALNSVHKEVISYKRDDGVELSGTLYLPIGYDKTKKEKMPMILWAYPVEYKDKSSAGQKTSNSNEFTFPYYGSPIYWVTRGYVVLDDAAFPIVGEGDNEPNDNFIPQLVANGKAAIDAVDKLGYIDRNRVAVGGHSYGAFMTANLLTHSDLFAAGIARSGAYNRTLTPFGFQSEERNYWEAPDIYNTMSPFMNADKMKHPLLLIHGEADNNSGTYPMQSERYFNALKGLGATVRLVMLPKESHGYSARKSILHLLWEQDQWLEKYVKNKE